MKLPGTHPNHHPDHLTVGIAQIAPVWLDRQRTLEKIIAQVETAAEDGCQLLVFGEALLPGYPFWIEHTAGATFNDARQKDIYAHYQSNAVQIEAGHLKTLSAAARQRQLAVYLGCIERPLDRGGHSLYASLVYIDPQGEIRSVHRKLMPTYEERLVWSTGDGHGLRTHRLGSFTIGGLNCWENWMPLARSALYAQGEDLHVAVWPGGAHNTREITRFIALEARSYVISASGLMRRQDISPQVPHAAEISASTPEWLANGGSCIAAPDGSWLVEPLVGEEMLVVAQLDFNLVRRERHNFDPAGHYARPDVLQVVANRQRQSTLKLIEEGEA